MTSQNYELTGQSLIAGKAVTGTGGTTTGWNPSTNEVLEPSYSLLRPEELAEATRAAKEAFDSLRALHPDEHSEFLNQIAANIEGAGDAIVERAMVETGLSETRLRGELARTTNQLRLFARVVREGNHHGARIDPAMPKRAPQPRLDIRQRTIPLGPVGVFGASNFPLAFSTAGGDTASALAAGCPVVFKAHNAHPGTGELVGQAITAAVRESGLHPGVFSLVYGPGSSIGQALVADPAIMAVGFTGSRAAGTSLMRTASERPVPIPVYAEMSSINPVFLMAGALAGEVSELAEAYVTSVIGSSGQLCTQPGLVFVPRGDRGDLFVRTVADSIQNKAGQTMLTVPMCESWRQGVEELSKQQGIEIVGRGSEGDAQNAPAPAVFQAPAASFRKNSALHEEIFGAASLIVRYENIDELLELSHILEGQLTATLHLTEYDHQAAQRLLPLLEQRAGRILVNSWPTGVEVNHTMVHGGPFPATSDSRTTSVGSLAIERFLRPVAYQNFPQELLPRPLHDDNPWNLNRLIDGVVTTVER